MAITLDGSNGITTDIASNESATFNRDTTDGDLIILQKDNATVGAIGTYNNDSYIGTDDTGVTFSNGMDALMPFNPSTVAVRDAGVDLGITTVRWRNLYLSGGVYLGGTGAANYLDDYEEGTWTPTGVSGGTWSSFSKANYVKIGNFVFYKFEANLQSDGSGRATFGGLPFAVTDSQSGITGMGNPSFDFFGGQTLTTEQVIFRHGLDTNNRTIRMSGFYYSEA